MDTIVSRTDFRRVARAVRAAVATAVLTALAFAGGTPGAPAAIEKPLNPCAFVTNDDVLAPVGLDRQRP
jgi:hypothetical protein